MFFFHVHREHFVRFHLLAVDFLEQHARTRHCQFITFAAHVFNQNRQVQFAAAAHFKHRFIIGELHAHGHIGLQFAFQAFANLTARHILAFTAGQGARVHLEVHRKRRFIDLEQRERFGLFNIGERRADGKFFNTVNQHDIARFSGIHKLAIQPFEHQNLIDFDFLGSVFRAIHHADFFACVNASAMHTADTDLAHVARVIERADLKLQRTVRIVITHRHLFDHGVENGAHIAHFLELFDVVAVASNTFQSRAINHREVQLFFGGAQLIKQVKRLIQNPIGARARAVNLIDHHDGL